jgi:H+/gluconate symporter-like permease
MGTRSPPEPDDEHRPPSSHGFVDRDFVQADIARAYDLRKEYYKYTIAISTALLAFTISFPPTLSTIAEAWLIKVAWLALGIAILCGVVVHYLWVWFFISFRDLDSRGHKDSGRLRRRCINWARRTVEIVQLLSILTGVLGVAAFAGANLENLALKPSAERSAQKDAG